MEESLTAATAKAEQEIKSDEDKPPSLKRDRDASSNTTTCSEQHVTVDSNTDASNHNNSNHKVARSAAPAAVDSFLASMTFAMPETAMAGRGGCDCDECGGSALIPQAIVDAIRKHKRERHETMPMKRSQHRSLLQRHGPSGVAVYEWTMPLNADPLVEFGSTHRFIWIKRLPNVFKTIGKGIVGSQQEERQRQLLDSWKQGDLYLVPSNGGKAIALIHSQDDETNSETQSSTTVPSKSTGGGGGGGGHAVLYICKIPLAQTASKATDSSNNNSDIHSDTKEWYTIVKDTCQQALEEFQNENTLKENSLQYQRIPEETSALLINALSNLNSESG